MTIMPFIFRHRQWAVVNDYVWKLIVRWQPLLLIKDLQITESVSVEIRAQGMKNKS